MLEHLLLLPLLLMLSHTAVPVPPHLPPALQACLQTFLAAPPLSCLPVQKSMPAFPTVACMPADQAPVLAVQHRGPLLPCLPGALRGQHGGGEQLQHPGRCGAHPGRRILPHDWPPEVKGGWEWSGWCSSVALGCAALRCATIEPYPLSACSPWPSLCSTASLLGDMQPTCTTPAAATLPCCCRTALPCSAALEPRGGDLGCCARRQRHPPRLHRQWLALRPLQPTPIRCRWRRGRLRSAPPAHHLPPGGVV
jgi:hypothetical protein